MALPLFQVDAFATRPFTGNPAAVCLLDEPRPAEWMQKVALEMNLAETAFLVRRTDGWDLRWFTPAVEVDLCGHATLASAHILWEQGLLAPDAAARFATRSGWLTCRWTAEGIEMDFPAMADSPAETPAGLLEALGTTAVYVGRNQFDYVVQVESEQQLRALRPDHSRLTSLPVRGVMVTCPAEAADFDFVSRFFAPGAGVPEDPVTGSAHCCLAPFWQKRLGKSEMIGYQASARGGVVHVRVAGERVFLSGQAVTIFRAELLC